MQCALDLQSACKSGTTTVVIDNTSVQRVKKLKDSIILMDIRVNKKTLVKKNQKNL